MAVHADSLSCHTCKALSVCIVPGPAHFIRHIMGRTGIFMPAGGASRRFCAFGRHCHIAGHIGTVRLLVAVAAFVYTPVLSIAPVCACHRDVCTMTVRTFCHRTIIANRCYRHQQCRQQKNGQQALQDSLVHRVPPLNFWVVRSARCSAFPLFYRGGVHYQAVSRNFVALPNLIVKNCYFLPNDAHPLFLWTLLSKKHLPPVFFMRRARIYRKFMQNRAKIALRV